MRKAILINFTTKYSVAIIQLIINLVLARLISPQEFGVVAIITVFSNFFILFSDMGIGASIIQMKELRQKDYNNIFSFTFYAGILLMIGFIGAGHILAFVYQNNVYILLGRILSISIFFSTLNIVPNAVLLKEQRFTEIGIRTALVSLISGIITVILAILDYKYYAVVIFTVFQIILSFVWNMSRISLRFSFKFKFDSVEKIFGYSFYQLLFNVTNYFVTNSDTLLVGKFLGEENVGLYNKSYQLMTYPVSMFSGAITPALHPVLSNYQFDKEKMYDYLVKIFRILIYFSIFISSICFFASREIISILYGREWSSATSSFQLLSLSIVTKMCNSITGSFYQSLGKVNLLFRIGLINGLLILGFTMIGVSSGTIEGVSLFIAIGYMLSFWIAFYFLIKKAFEKKFSVFLEIAGKPYLIYIILLCITHFYSITIDNIVGSLIVKTVILTGSYLLLLLGFREYHNFKNTCGILFQMKWRK